MYNLNQETTFNAKATHLGFFKMFVAYEDRSAFGRAKSIQRELARRCHAELLIEDNCWNFALLSHPRLREHAVSEAGEADMVVISAQGSAEVSPHLQSWIKRWLAQQRNPQTALVLLLDPESAVSSDQPAISRLLRRLAAQAGIEFLCNWREPERPRAARTKSTMGKSTIAARKSNNGRLSQPNRIFGGLVTIRVPARQCLTQSGFC